MLAAACAHSLTYRMPCDAFLCMMRNTLASVCLLLGVCAHAAEVMPAPDLEAPAASDEKRVSEIKTIGLQWWVRNRGLLAEESLEVAGYFSVARPIASFAARDDRVWEVRVRHLHTRGPTGIVWINDTTEKVIALGAEEKDDTEPDAAVGGTAARR